MREHTPPSGRLDIRIEISSQPNHLWSIRKILGDVSARRDGRPEALTWMPRTFRWAAGKIPAASTPWTGTPMNFHAGEIDL